MAETFKEEINLEEFEMKEETGFKAEEILPSETGFKEEEILPSSTVEGTCSVDTDMKGKLENN